MSQLLGCWESVSLHRILWAVEVECVARQTERQAVDDILKRTLFSIVLNPKVYYLHCHLSNRDMERTMTTDYASVLNFKNYFLQ